MIRIFWTMLAVGLTIIWTSAANAQLADRDTAIHVIGGASHGRARVAAAEATTAAMPMARNAITSAQPAASSDGTPQKKVLVGSWLETVTFPPESGRPQLKSLVTFHDDETVVTSDQGSVTTDPPGVFSSGHGAWAGLEKRTFAYTLIELISDLSGNLVGYLRVQGIYTVSQSGNEYNGTSIAGIFDTAGNVLFSAEVINAGQRITVETP